MENILEHIIREVLIFKSDYYYRDNISVNLSNNLYYGMMKALREYLIGQCNPCNAPFTVYGIEFKRASHLSDDEYEIVLKTSRYVREV